MPYIEEKKGGFLVGSGGGGGKGGGGSARTPEEAPDNLKSTAYALVLDVLSNGEIYGPVHRDDPLRDVYLDGTPVKNSDGTFNFKDIEMHFRYGTPDQEHIPGFPSASNTTQVGVTLSNTNHYTKLLTNKDLSAVRVTIYSPRLVSLIVEGDRVGDREGATVEYAIDLSSSGGPYQNVLTTSMTGKGSGYSKTHRIDLPEGEENWSIRVRRITPVSTSSNVENTLIVQSVTEVVDGKFRYPMTAIAGMKVDSSQFSSIPTRAFRVRGQIIKVPSNYDPITRKYTGTWDGTFKRAWSNNPAWVYYDILTNKLYGLGERVQSWMVDRYSLYQIGAYCDQMVPDGFGGMEPRFACNVYIQGQEDALKVLNDLASVFRGMSYWANGEITAVADRPSDPVYTFTNSNVVDGSFHYSGSDLSTRYTTALVSWNDPEDFYAAKVEVVQDLTGIAKRGIRKVEVNAFGCTSRGQAHRVGNYILYTSRRETGAVSFTVGLDGVIPQPGDVVKIADKNRAGRALGGRVASATSTQITTDQDQKIKVRDTLLVNMPDGKVESRKVQAVSGRTVTVSPRFSKVPQKESVWAVDSSDLVTQLARVISVAETDDVNYAISAVLHSPNKYDEIDHNIDLEELPVSVIPPRNQVAPKNIRLSDYTTIHQGSSVGHLVIEWDKAPNAINYDVQWRKDNGEWISEPRTGTRYITISNIYSGNYEARVRAINALDVPSLWGSSSIHTVTGLGIDPPSIIGLETNSIPWGIELKWFFSTTVNIVSHTQIRFSRTPNFNDSQLLGDIAYPTRNYSHTNLAAGVELFYWARLIDKNGVQGPWFPSEDEAGVRGQTSIQADEYNELITQEIVESALGQQLMEDIQAIPDIKDQLTDFGIDFEQIGINFDQIDGKFSATDAEITALEAQVAQLIGTEEWDPDSTYLEGTLVQDAGALYRAQKDVPAGTPVNNTEFWIKVGDFSSLGEAVTALLARMNVAETTIDSITGQVTAHAQQLTTLASEVQSIDGQVQGNATAIDRIETEVTELDGVVSAVSERESLIVASLRDADDGHGQLTNVINTHTNRAWIKENQTAIVTAEEAIARVELELGAQIDENRSFITQSFEAIADLDRAQSIVTTELWSAVGDNQSSIQSTNQTIADNQSAQSLINDALEARIDSADSNISANAGAVSALEVRVNEHDGELSSQSSSITSLQNKLTTTDGKITANAGAISGLQTTVSTQGGLISSQGQSITQLQNSLNDPSTGLTANAAAISSLNTKVNTVDGKVTAQAKSINQIESRVGGVSASVQDLSRTITSIDGKIQATRTIKVAVNSGGTQYMAGIGVGVDNSTGGMQSQVVVVANRFSVMHTINGSPKAVFSVQGGVAFINDAMIRNASITTAKIKDASVGTLKIGNNAVTVPSGNYIPGTMHTGIEETKIIELNVTTTGQPVHVQVSFFAKWLGNIDSNKNKTHEWNMKVVRHSRRADGSITISNRFSGPIGYAQVHNTNTYGYGLGSISYSFKDEVWATNSTYFVYVWARHEAGGRFDSPVGLAVNQRTIMVTELKR